MFSVVFFLVTAIHLAAILGGDAQNTVVVVTKPMLLPVLIILFYLHSAAANKVFRMLVLLALLFSWVGDVLLLNQEQDARFFLGGLVSFLVAHICYLFAFRKTSLHHSLTALRQYPWLILFFLAYGIAFFFLIRKGLGDMLVPVLCYMVIILIMAITALNRFRRVEFKSFVLVFAGALCFMLSDSLLAANKFAAPFPLSGFLIMLTYVAAQYLIVMGCLRQIASEKMRRQQ